MTDVVLTPPEQEADLTVERLKQLVGLVPYDESKDPFPVTAMDAIVMVAGNATQSAQYYQHAFGMTLVAYSGPETGNRDHKAFVLKSGSARFVIIGGVAPDSAYLDHHRAHGDGVIDLALEVPDVDKCVEQARRCGATILDEPYELSDDDGTVRLAAIAIYGDTRHTLIDRSQLPRRLPARLRARAPRAERLCSACSARSTTASATSSSAGWTSGSTSTTASWAS